MLEKPATWKRIGVFVLGFLIPFNMFVMPWTSQSPRATDMLGVFLTALLVGLVIWYRRLKLRNGAVVYTILVLLIPMYWHTLMVGGGASIVDQLRWLTGLGWGIALVKLAGHRHLRGPLFRGMMVGAAICVSVAVLQAIGFLELTQALGIAARDSVDDVGFGSIWRVPGMEENVNASAAVFSLTIPLAIGLFEERRIGRLSALLAIMAAVIGSAVTLNRSSLLVGVVVALGWVFFGKRQGTGRLSRILLLLLGAGLLIYVGPPGGWQRWQALENLSTSGNFIVRLRTTLAAVDLSLQYPFGLGREYADILRIQSDVNSDSTHNAFLFLSLTGGIPIALFVFTKLAWYSTSILRKSRVEHWLALHMFGLYFFEEFLATPTFLVLTLMLLVQPWVLHETPMQAEGRLRSEAAMK